MFRLLKNLNELVMFKHSIFSLPFIFIAMIIASNGFFGWKLLLLGALAAITARNFAMAYNRYVDVDIDKLNPRTSSRPSVDGRVTKKTQLIFFIANAIGFILITYFVNSTAFFLSFPIIVLLGAYSHFKRFSSLAHLFLGITLGLAPLAGAIAVLGYTPLWSWLLGLGVVFWVAGFDLLYSLQDIEFDKKYKLHSIPSIYGEKATMFISKLFHLNTIIFWLLFAFSINASFFIFLAVFLSAIMLFVEHKIVEKDFKKIDKAFFTINGYLGVMFLLFVIISFI